MKTLLLTAIAIILLAQAGMGQRKPKSDTIRLVMDSAATAFDLFSIKHDTIPVIAFCLDTVTLKTQWIKLFGVSGWDYPSINMNGIVLYKQYLMPDRKATATYKVIYSINSK